MKYLFFIILFSIAFTNSNLFGQSKMSYDFVVASGYSFRSLIADNDTAKLIIKGRNSVEKPYIALKGGLAANYNLNQFSVGLGIFLSKKTYKLIPQTNYIIPYNLDPLYGNNGTNNTSLVRLDEIFFTYNYYYCDIPLTIRYNLINKKSKFYIFSGVETNIYVSSNNKTVIKYTGGSKRKSTDKNKSEMNAFNLSYVGGIGFQYFLNDKLGIKIEPYYDRNLFSIIDAPVKEYLYATGINITLTYN